MFFFEVCFEGKKGKERKVEFESVLEWAVCVL